MTRSSLALLLATAATTGVIASARDARAGLAAEPFALPGEARATRPYDPNATIEGWTITKLLRAFEKPAAMQTFSLGGDTFDESDPAAVLGIEIPDVQLGPPEDVSGVPGRPPRPIADVKLAHPLTGSEAGCAYDCARDGWVQASVSGCYVFVGDAGDVISTRTDRVVGFLPAMRDSRKMIEVDWRNGRPVATSTRSGIGRVTGRPLPPPTCG